MFTDKFRIHTYEKKRNPEEKVSLLKDFEDPTHPEIVGEMIQRPSTGVEIVKELKEKGLTLLDIAEVRASMKDFHPIIRPSSIDVIEDMNKIYPKGSGFLCKRN